MNILVTEPQMMAQSVRSVLETLGSVSYGPFTEEEFIRKLPDCNVLMIRLGRYIGPEVLEKALSLRCVVSATTGLDHIDLRGARTAGVRVISLRDCMDQIQGVSATAEHTWGLMLSLIRSTHSAATHVLAGGWDRNLFWGSQLKGKALGIVGHGRVGAMIARYGSAFGMEVLAFDVDWAKVCPPARAVSFDELVQHSDVLTLHATADPDNHHLIDRAVISRFKRGAFFVNTARGMLADSTALAEAVVSGHLAGVAVDVLEGEERNLLAGDPLIKCASSGHNVLITPHIGGATRESIETAELAVVLQLRMQYQ